MRGDTAAARVGRQAMRRMARLLTHVFFRRIEVSGAERLPDGPVVLVANHVNGLVDGMVLLGALERYPRFLGKSTLFKILPLAPFLRLAGVVAVYRASDGSTERNREAFATAGAILGGGAMVAVFPEGVSHDDAQLHPLRTGAARIALATDGVAVVPVGLVYDDKARFRSQALVRIGEPFLLTTTGVTDEAAVRALTARIGEALATVAPMFGSRQDELLFQRAGEVTLAASGIMGGLAGRDDIARRLALGPPPAVAALRDATTRYEEHLGALGLRDEDVVAGLTPARYRRRRAGRLAALAAAAPVAAVGAAVHAVPYGVMKQVAKRPANEGMRATVKLLGNFGVFTMLYTALGVAVGRRRGALAGVAAFAAGPTTGYVTVRVAEEVARAGGLARARALLAQDESAVSALLDERAAVVRATRAALAPSPLGS